MDLPRNFTAILVEFVYPKYENQKAAGQFYSTVN